MTSLFALPELIRQQQEQDDEEKSVAGKAVAASLENRVRTTGAMDPNEFQNRFREGVSPAREVLANMMAGVSSKMLGTTFKPVRQRMLEEYTKQKQVQQNEERMLLMDQQKQMADQRMREIAAQASKDRQDATSARRELGFARQAIDADRTDILRRRQDILENKDLRDEEKQALLLPLEAELKEAQAKKAGVPKDSYQAARELVTNQGGDPDADLSTVLDLAKQIEGVKKAGKFAPVGPQITFTPQDAKNIADAKARGWDLTGIPARVLSPVVTEMLASPDKFVNPKQREAIQKFQNALSAADKLADFGEKLFVFSGPEARVRGLQARAEAALGRNPTASTFVKQRTGLRSVLARTFGEVGNLNDTEQEAALGVIPDLGDSKEEFEMKRKLLYGIIKTQVQSTISNSGRVYNEDFKGFLSTKQAAAYGAKVGVKDPKEIRKLVESQGYVVN